MLSDTLTLRGLCPADRKRKFDSKYRAFVDLQDDDGGKGALLFRGRTSSLIEYHPQLENWRIISFKDNGTKIELAKKVRKHF